MQDTRLVYHPAVHPHHSGDTFANVEFGGDRRLNLMEMIWNLRNSEEVFSQIVFCLCGTGKCFVVGREEAKPKRKKWEKGMGREERLVFT
jgi:hypothetical protein